MFNFSSKYYKYILAAISGLILTAAFPKIGWSSLAWVAFIPFFAAISGETLRNSLRIGFVMGVCHHGTLLYWIVGVCHTYGRLPIVVAIAIMLLLACYLSLYTAIFAFLLNKFREKSIGYTISASILLPCLEFIRSFLFTGFPWENLGHSQFEQISLLQSADLFSGYGLSALIIATNAVIFVAAERYKKEKIITWHRFAIVIVLIVAFWGYGTWRIKEIDKVSKRSTHKRVTLVQGNIDQSLKWNPAYQKKTIDRYVELTRSAQTPDTALTIWPETALPFYFLRDEPLTTMALQDIEDIKGYLLTGSPSYIWKNGKLSYLNSAYLIAPGGEVAGRYDKVHLVPFGEYVPLRNWFPFLGKIVEAVGDFTSGEKGQLLKWEDNPIGVLICFEIIFPDLARELTKKGARLLITITNDAWFGRSSAPYQHLSMAAFRAVENRVAIARAANTGISAFIDPAGRIAHQTPLFQATTLSASIPLMESKTFYTRFGDIFPIMCLLIACCGMCWKKS
ncbi:MAG: apolipoprotein N-acyltransferase [Pseudomonadota bacterium]